MGTSATPFYKETEAQKSKVTGGWTTKQQGLNSASPSSRASVVNLATLPSSGQTLCTGRVGSHRSISDMPALSCGGREEGSELSRESLARHVDGVCGEGRYSLQGVILGS